MSKMLSDQEEQMIDYYQWIGPKFMKELAFEISFEKNKQQKQATVNIKNSYILHATQGSQHVLCDFGVQNHRVENSLKDGKLVKLLELQFYGKVSKALKAISFPCI